MDNTSELQLQPAHTPGSGSVLITLSSGSSVHSPLKQASKGQTQGNPPTWWN